MNQVILGKKQFTFQVLAALLGRWPYFAGGYSGRGKDHFGSGGVPDDGIFIGNG